MGLSTIKRSAEFQRVRGGLRVATPLFVIEARRRTVEPTGETVAGPRVGFTITKKIGCAVVRNRIRRRLKGIFRSNAGARLKNDHDYVVVARNQIVDHPFRDLEAALDLALEKLHNLEHAGGGRAWRGDKSGSGIKNVGPTTQRDTASRTIRPKTRL